ncbi:MAG: Ig-like domain-containing protein, partial [Nocardioides sp.]
LPVDYAQHAVGVTFPGSAPAEYEAGDPLEFSVSSLAMTGASDVQDTQVEAFLGATSLGTFPVANTLQDLPFDEAGTATVSALVPAGVEDGIQDVVLRGLTTGTEVVVPVAFSDGLPNATVTAADVSMVYGQPGSVAVMVDPAAATGAVTLLDGLTVLATAPLDNGSASIPLAVGSLPVGVHVLTLDYPGDAGYSGDQATVTVTVTKATPTVTATPDPAFVNIDTETSSIAVTVTGTGVSPTGTVTASVNGEVVDTKTLSGGAATLVVGPFSTIGDKVVTITYAGDATTASGSTTTQVYATQVVPDPVDPVVTTTTATAAPMVYGTAGQVQVSVGSTKPTSGSVQLMLGDTVIGSGNVAADGTVAIPVAGTALPAGTHGLTVAFLGDAANQPSQGSVTLVVSQAGSATQAVVSPAEVVVSRGRVTVQASVTADGYTPTGSVQVRVDGDPVATRTLTDGSISMLLAPFESVGARTVSVIYLGDGNTAASHAVAGTVEVVKATPRMTVTKSPAKVKVNRTRVRLTAVLAAPGQQVTGWVRVTFGSATWADQLQDQRAVIVLPPFHTRGLKTVTVEYGGSGLAEAVTKRVTIRVVR